MTPTGGALSSFPPSCSPPTFQLTAANLGLSCPESYFHHLGLPICYKICPASLLRQQPLAFPSPHKLANAAGAPGVPHFMVDVPALSSLSIANVKSSKAEDLNRSSSQGPGSVSHMLYGLHASGNVFPSGPVSPDTLSCSLHPPYSLYGYNFSVPSRLMNSAGHFKTNNGVPSPLRESRCNPSSWPPTINDCL